MPYDILRNRNVEEGWNDMNTPPVVQQPPVQEQPIQREQPVQMSQYQQMMSRLPNAKYLGDDYRMDKWLADDEASGVTNPFIRMMRYNTFAKPLVDQAREDEIRESFGLASNPNTDPQIKTEALAKLAYYMKNPDLVNETNLKRMRTLHEMGLMENPNFGGTNSEYGGDDQNARQIYSHLKSRGLSDNVIAGIMGNLQQESGFNPNAVGDGGNSIGLAQWYQDRGNALRNFAQKRGTDWNHIGTQLDYLLDEVNRGYPDLFKQMSSMSPYDAAILFHDTFERSADSPEMKAMRGKNADAIFNGRKMAQQYVADPNYVSPREKYNRQIYENDRNYNLQKERLDRLINQDQLRYGNGGGRQRGVNQQALNKANTSMRNSALNLAQLQNVNPEEEGDIKKYESGMSKFSNDISSLCQYYDDGSMDSLTFGLALYNELNKTKSGLRPETLAEGVARAVYAQRGDVDAGELQREILNYVYGQGEQKQQGAGNSVADFRRYDNEHPYDYKFLEMADKKRANRNSWDNAFRQ